LGWQQYEALTPGQSTTNEPAAINSAKPKQIGSPLSRDHIGKPSKQAQRSLAKPIDLLLQSAKEQTGLTRSV